MLDKYIISTDTLQSIINYLAARPYNEVVTILNLLGNEMQPQQVQATEKVPE